MRRGEEREREREREWDGGGGGRTFRLRRMAWAPGVRPNSSAFISPVGTGGPGSAMPLIAEEYSPTMDRVRRPSLNTACASCRAALTASRFVSIFLAITKMSCGLGKVPSQKESVRKSIVTKRKRERSIERTCILGSFSSYWTAIERMPMSTVLR